MFHFDPFTFRFGRLTRLGGSISASFLVLFSFLSVALSSSEYGPAVLASRQARVSAHFAPSQARSYLWCAGVLNRSKRFRLVDTSEHHRPGLTASSLEMGRSVDRGIRDSAASRMAADGLLSAAQVLRRCRARWPRPHHLRTGVSSAPNQVQCEFWCLYWL